MAEVISGGKGGGKGKALYVYREKKKKLKAGGGTSSKGKVTQTSRQETIYDAKGKELGVIFFETQYKGRHGAEKGKVLSAGPKGFGKKTKIVKVKGSGYSYPKISKKKK